VAKNVTYLKAVDGDPWLVNYIVGIISEGAFFISFKGSFNSYVDKKR
jgi:hypothetical protein